MVDSRKLPSCNDRDGVKNGQIVRYAPYPPPRRSPPPLPLGNFSLAPLMRFQWLLLGVTTMLDRGKYNDVPRGREKERVFSLGQLRDSYTRTTPSSPFPNYPPPWQRQFLLDGTSPLRAPSCHLVLRWYAGKVHGATWPEPSLSKKGITWIKFTVWSINITEKKQLGTIHNNATRGVRGWLRCYDFWFLVCFDGGKYKSPQQHKACFQRRSWSENKKQKTKKAVGKKNVPKYPGRASPCRW